jgi:hypothetical protein
MGGEHKIRFGVYNSGDKSARGVYWDVYMPMNYGDYELHFNNVRPERVNVVVGNGAYQKYSGYFDSPVFPSKTLQFGTITILAETFETFPSIGILWHLTGEDGNFPTAADAGKLALSFNEPPMNR